MTRPLAVLRPEPGNATTATRIEALGLTAIRQPLFQVRPLAWHPPDPASFDALLLTSAQAVRLAGPGLAAVAHLPVVAVGRATAQAAETAGLLVETAGRGGVADAVASSRRTRLLHLAGRDHVAAGCTAIPVYAADPLPVATTSQLAGCVALLHSARAARRLTELLARDGIDDVRVAAISEGVRAAGPALPGLAADRPNDAELIAVAARLAAD